LVGGLSVAALAGALLGVVLASASAGVGAAAVALGDGDAVPVLLLVATWPDAFVAVGASASVESLVDVLVVPGFPGAGISAPVSLLAVASPGLLAGGSPAAGFPPSIVLP
jgi:hypothetical protein